MKRMPTITDIIVWVLLLNLKKVKNKRLERIKKNSLFVDYCQNRKPDKINKKLTGANKRVPKYGQM